MTERDIESRVVAIRALLEKQLKKDKDVNKEAQTAILMTLDLVGNLFVDINRIANAAEASHPMNKKRVMGT